MHTSSVTIPIHLGDCFHTIMSKLSLKQKTTTKQNTTYMPLLRGLLEEPLEQLERSNRPKTTSVEASEGTTAVTIAKSGETETIVTSAANTSKSGGPKQHNIPKTYTGILAVNQARSPTGRFKPYWGDVNTRGKNAPPKVTVKDLTKCLIDNQIYETEQWTRFATERDVAGFFAHPEAHEIHWELGTKAGGNYTKQLAQAIKMARGFTPDIPYIERIEKYSPGGDESSVGELYYQDYRKAFNHLGITKERLQRWFNTLAMDNGKRNTIYMCGRANAGKTTIIELLSAFYEPWEIGRAQPQSAQSNFFLQDLVGKRLFHADEILATPLNIDTLKLLLEGNKDLASDVKYGDKEAIKPRPVLIGTNDPLWINFSTAAEPILARCEFLAVRKPLPRLSFIKPKSKKILQYVLWRMYEWAFDGKGRITGNHDKAFDDSLEIELPLSTEDYDYAIEQITEMKDMFN